MPITTTRLPEPAGARPPLRTRAAVTAGRSASRISRLVRLGNGTVIGGVVAARVDPDVLARLAIGRAVVLVSATNGKSTTTRMLADAVATSGPVGYNDGGSNMEAGLVMALARAPAGRPAVLEVDEAVLGPVCRRTRPQVVTLMNLSREYTRGVSMRRLVRHWRDTAARLDDGCTVVANSDDPLVVSAAAAAGRVIWVAGGTTWRDDAAVCPTCLAPVRWDGDDWACTGCGLHRPEPAWRRHGTRYAGPGVDVHLDVRTPGRWTASNALFALAAARAVGITPAVAAAAIGRVADVGGRYAPFAFAGREVRLFLVKNPASWNEAISLVTTGAPVVFALEPFGIKDMTPQWDVDVRGLAGSTVAVSGQRRFDLAVLLDLHGVAFDLFADPLDAVRAMPPGPVHVVANYTAFLALKRALKE